MKILFLTKYSRLGASSRLRTLQYIPFFEKAGLDVTISELFDEPYLNRLYSNRSRSVTLMLKLYFVRLFWFLRSYRYDLIWIEKEVFPYIPAVAERLLTLFRKPYLVDYDDAIFHNYDLSKHLLIRKALGKKIDVVMRNSACVLAGNQYLASRANVAGAKWIELVPTVVDHTRYIPRSDSRSLTPVVGWIGSPSTQKYVVDIREALIKACKVQGARLMLVGATPQVVKEFSGLDVQVFSWSEESEAELIRQMDIGIMPLSDGPWEKGKCGYKLIQYMACAVPVIASPVGVNVDIVSGSNAGLLADSHDEWESSLIELLSSAQKRSEFGAAGRSAVENKYSLQVQAQVLSRIIAETASLS